MRALVYSAPGQAEVTEAERPVPGPGEVLVRSRVVGSVPLRPGAAGRPVHHPDRLPGRPRPRVGRGGGRGRAGRRRTSSRATRWWGSAWSGPAAETTSASRSPAPPPSTSPPGRSGCTSSRPADVHPGRPGRAVHRRPTRRSGPRVIDPSDRVAVLGGGPIGLLSAMAAVGRNATVTLIEPRPDRRAKAAELGVSRRPRPGRRGPGRSGPRADRRRPVRRGHRVGRASGGDGPGAHPRRATTAGSSTWASTSAARSRPSSA